MKKQLSIIASAAVLSTAAYAESNTISKAFENGKTSGDLSAHYQSWDNDNAADSGFSVGTIGVNYSTDSFSGLTLNTGFRAAHVFTEKEDNDSNDDIAVDSVMNVFNISYANNFGSLTVGRQEIDLEWLGDFNEAAVAAITTIPSTTLVLGYTTRQAVAGNDEISKFADVTKDGAYVVDAKYEGIEGAVLNPYFYSAKDAADFYGFKADYDNDMFGLTGHYAASSEDAASTKKDGSIMAFEARTAFAGVSLSAGYISVDEDGIGSMDSFGDNIDPTEELGDYVYAADAKTIYATAGYTIADVELAALYAQADSDATNKKDKELTVGAAYSFNDNLSAEVMYTDLSLESADDASKLVANVTYEF